MNVAIVGLGTIGLGWVKLFRETDHRLFLFDNEPAARARALEVALEGDRSTDAVAVDSLAEAVARADYVQESLPELLPLKQQIFTSLSELAPPACVLASSASGIPISAVSQAATNPSRCLVVHPMNPPYLMPLVELVPGPETGSAALEMAEALMLELGRTPIRCDQEVAGFVANRLQCALEREAFELLREGVASAAAIELAVKAGLGPRWSCLGPFGVEATNGAGIADTLTKFQDYFESMFAAIGRPFSDLADAEIEQMREGLIEVYGTDDSSTLKAYRDSALQACHQAVEAAAEETLHVPKEVSNKSIKQG